MTAYKKILVAVDISSETEQVLEAASDIAEQNGAEIAILHVAQTPVSPYSQWSDYVVPISEMQLQEALFAQLSELVESAGLSKSLIKIVFGRPIDIIVDQAEQSDTDLIVMGTHGRRGLKRLLGSTANGVLHHTNCDVLAVRV
ncbi:MAG: universal stress protein, partial [Oceanicoccus sp.]